MSETEVNELPTMDFFIGLKEIPTRWYPIGEEDRRNFQETKKIFTTVERTLEEGRHPGLRYEDIVAHLMMQVMAYRELEDLVTLLKTARQYGNQAMKKICRNCTYGRHTAKGIDSDSSRDFVDNINDGECNEKCEECRVGRTIMVANTMYIFIWGFEEIDKLRGYAVRWKKKWWNTHKKLKKQRWLTKQKSTMVTGIIGAKIALEKQNRELREALKEVTGGRPIETHKLDASAIFDEFAEFESKELDGEAIKKIHKIIEKAEKEGLQVITGSIKKELTDEEVAQLAPDIDMQRIRYNLIDDNREHPLKDEPAMGISMDDRHPLKNMEELDEEITPEDEPEEVKKFNKEVDEAEFRKKYPGIALDEQAKKKKDALLHLVKEKEPQPEEILHSRPGYSEPTEDDLLDNIEPANMTPEQTKRAKELRDRANSE